MKNLNASIASPSSPIKVDIFNSQYSIKPTENLTEDDIRELADHVDGMMRQVSQKGSYDKLSVAIMVALNVAAQMCEDQKRCANSIRQLVQMMDEAMDGDTNHDALRAVPTSDPKYSMQRQR
jgi:cell division protein ZapA (FtsZ GTPase activity inhibitor)